MKKDLTMKDEEIVRILRPLQEKADKWYDDLKEEREKCRKLYDREKFGNEREGFSKYISPLVWNTVEWLKPGVVSIFASPDFFDVKTKDEKLGRRIKSAIRYQMFGRHGATGKKELRAFVHDTLLYHFGLTKVCYREFADEVPEKYDSLNEEQFLALAMEDGVTVSKYDEVEGVETGVDEFGIPIELPVRQYENVKAVRRKVKYAGPVFEVIPGHEFRMVQAKSIEASPMVAHVRKKTLDEIKRGEMNGQYLKGSYKKLTERIAEISTESRQSDEALELLYGADGLTLQTDDGVSWNEKDKASLPSNQVEVWECYVKLDIDGDGLLEPCIVSLCGDIVLQKQENEYGEPTIGMGRIFEIPHRAEGRPLPMILEDDQKEQTNLKRIFVDSSAESAYSTMVTSDPQLARSWAKRKVGSVMLAQSDKFQEVRPKPPGRTSLDALEMMRIDSERSVGVNSLNQGIDDNSYGKTATGTMALQNAGQQKQRFYVSVMADAVEDIIRRYIEINKKWPPVAIYNPADPNAPQPGDFENLDDYDIEIKVGIGPMDRAGQVQALELHFQKLVQVMIPQGIAGPEHLLATQDKIGRLQDVSFADLQFSPEQFNTVQQMQQQMQKMGAQLQQLQGALNVERQRAAGAFPHQAMRPNGPGAMGQPVLAGPSGAPGPGIPGRNPVPGPGPGGGVPRPPM